MIRRFKTKQDPKKFYRANERIFAHTLRVLGSDGKQIGILSKFEALKKARELDLDLVEIAPNAKPPVAKLIDFNKFLYQEEKKKKEEKKKARSSETKELRLGPFMDDHDLEVIIRKSKEFLKQNNKVKLVVKFKGRQIQHPEFGESIINKVTESLSSISKVDKEKHFEGKQLVEILSPERGKDGKEKNQEISK